MHSKLRELHSFSGASDVIGSEMWLVVFLKLLTAAVVFVLGLIEYQRRRLSNRFQHIPGPKEYPIVGSILTLKSNKLTDYQDKFDQICVEPISKLIFAGQLILLVSEPVALQQILSSQAFLSKPFMSDFLGLKYGLSSAKCKYLHADLAFVLKVTLSDLIWKPIRKGINVAFSHRASVALIPLFNKHVDKYCHELEPLLGAAPFDMYEVCVKVTIAQLLGRLTLKIS